MNNDMTDSPVLVTLLSAFSKNMFEIVKNGAWVMVRSTVAWPTMMLKYVVAAFILFVVIVYVLSCIASQLYSKFERVIKMALVVLVGSACLYSLDVWNQEKILSCYALFQEKVQSVTIIILLPTALIFVLRTNVISYVISWRHAHLAHIHLESSGEMLKRVMNDLFREAEKGGEGGEGGKGGEASRTYILAYQNLDLVADIVHRAQNDEPHVTSQDIAKKVTNILYKNRNQLTKR
jgi:hypothetical protein